MSSAACVAFFPGSFDPLTLGHEDIVRRSLAFADRIVVGVAHQPSESKKHLFPVEERLELIREVFDGEGRVEAASYEGLSVDFARSIGARVVLRGIRNAGDFEYEARMARMNRQLAAEIDTVYLAAEPRHVYLSASLVREVWRLGGDVSAFVPPAVLRRLQDRKGVRP
jgi:pantetheine-phosphate adenylyltransferase